MEGYLAYRGGEAAALDRLDTYFWKLDLLKVTPDHHHCLSHHAHSRRHSCTAHAILPEPSSHALPLPWSSTQEYKETRNGLLGPNFSSKFSPWLATGCLSPRFAFHEIQR